MATPDTSAAAAALDPPATVAAVERHAVTRWWQLTGFIEVRGIDAVQVLDGTCTQAVASIAPGTARLGCFLDGRARVLAGCLLHRADDVGDEQVLLLATTRDRVDELVRHLVKYRLRARARIEAVDLGTIGVVGAEAPVIAAAAGEGWYDDPTWGAVPARTWVGPHDAAGELVRSVLPAAGAPCADCDALEALRIDAGMPSVHDFVIGRMPAKVGAMLDAVALDKGCYLGQEPVARLHYRGRANRTLRRVQLSGAVPPEVRASAAAARTAADGAGDAVHESLLDPLALVLDDDVTARRASGSLTTWARRADGTWTAFAVVRRELEPGARLELAHAKGTAVELIDGPDDLAELRGR